MLCETCHCPGNWRLMKRVVWQKETIPEGEGKSRLRESRLLFPRSETFLQFSQQLSKVPLVDAFHSYSQIFPRLNFSLYNDRRRPRFVYCSHRKSTGRSSRNFHLNRRPLPRIHRDTERTMSILSSRRTIINYELQAEIIVRPDRMNRWNQFHSVASVSLRFDRSIKFIQ